MLTSYLLDLHLLSFSLPSFLPSSVFSLGEFIAPWLFLRITTNNTINLNTNSNTNLYLFGNFSSPQCKTTKMFSFKTLAIPPFQTVFHSSNSSFPLSNCSNLYTADGHVSQPISYFNSFNLQDHSQHPPYVPPCKFSCFLFFYSVFLYFCQLIVLPKFWVLANFIAVIVFAGLLV